MDFSISLGKLFFSGRVIPPEGCCGCGYALNPPEIWGGKSPLNSVCVCHALWLCSRCLMGADYILMPLVSAWLSASAVTSLVSRMDLNIERNLNTFLQFPRFYPEPWHTENDILKQKIIKNLASLEGMHIIWILDWDHLMNKNDGFGQTSKTAVFSPIQYSQASHSENVLGVISLAKEIPGSCWDAKGPHKMLLVMYFLWIKSNIKLL